MGEGDWKDEAFMNGKSIWLWRAKYLLGTFDAEKIADRAVYLGFDAVYVKICDGPWTFKEDGVDYAAQVIPALQRRGIEVWGWGYIYGYQPEAEARIAAQRSVQLGVKGFVIDAEAEYKKTGMAGRARTYMSTLRRLLPDKRLGLATYRYPTVHRELPWAEFARGLDFWMPQVYWQGATNAGAQLERSLNEYRALERSLKMDALPYSPLGSAYSEHGWTAKPAEIVDFSNTAKRLGLPGVSFWSWQHAEALGLVQVIQALEWSVPDPKPEPEEIVIPAPPPVPTPITPPRTLEQRVDGLETWARSQGMQ